MINIKVGGKNFMKKRILSLLTAVLLMIPALPTQAKEFDSESALNLLVSMNVMNGYPDGSYHLENYVTRAEFVKIAIAASDMRNSVATNMTVSPFPDVPYSFWGAPYIKLAVSNKLITGYADASFRPNNYVTLEEAATICLKLLGYINDDFGSSWPYGQMGLANSLDLTENIQISVGEAMTRGDVVNMVFNLLNTKCKGSNSYYIEKLDYQIVEDVILIATAEEDVSVGSDKILTSSGTYRLADSFDRTQIGKKGDLVLKNGDEAVMFVPSGQKTETYSVYQTLADDVLVYQNGSVHSLDLDSGMSVYYKSSKTTLSAILKEISAGDVIELYKNASGVLDYAMVRTDKMVGPITVSSVGWQNQLGISDSSSLTVLRDGSRASASDIATYDIVYYSAELSTVWAYSKKVTGIYESASPNRDSVTSVVVSGTSYDLETAAAINALSSTGSFRYGDTVTLLIGRNGGVADVVSSAQTGKTVYGYFAASGKKDYTNTNGEKYNSYYAEIVMPNGSSYQYATSKDYSSALNRVVKLSFTNGVADITTQSVSSVSGTVSSGNRKIGSDTVASDVSILEVSTTDSNAVSSYRSVFLQRLDGVSLSTGDVLYSAKNDKGEIKEMILCDVTGDTAQYGVVLSAPEKGSGATGGTYSLDINGETKNYSSNSVYSVSGTVPVKIQLSGNQLKSLSALTLLDESVKSVSDSYLETKNSRYLLSDSVVAYKKTGNYKYMIIPLSEVIDNKDVTVTAYYDRQQKFGGRIRVLIVKEK